MEERPVL